MPVETERHAGTHRPPTTLADGTAYPDAAFDGTVLTVGRDDPDLSQRFSGTLVDDGRTIDGLWTLSRDGRTWDDDLRVTYRRSD